MTRVHLTDGTGRWFDYDKAREYKASDYPGPTPQKGWISLYVTGKGMWVRYCRSIQADVEDTWHQVSQEDAENWLVSNGHYASVPKPLKNLRYKIKRSRGRPPATHPLKPRKIRATDDQWTAWEQAAAACGVPRNAWLRQVLDAACDTTPFH